MDANPENPGDRPPIAPPSPPAATPLTCAACGYPLHTVGPMGRCPECGLSIAASLRGRLLQHADADWRRQLQTGAAFVLIAPAIAIAMIVVVMLWNGIGVLIGADSAASGPPTWIYSLAMMVAAGLLARGWWLFTHDEPDAPVSTRTHILGWILRFTSIGGLIVVTIIWIIENALDWLGSAGAGDVIAKASIVPLGLIGLTHLVAAMLFLSLLAARVPSVKMARDLRRSAWLFALAGVLEGVYKAIGWRPGSSFLQGSSILLAVPTLLLNLLAAVAVLGAPLYYTFSALWLWRKLRASQHETQGPPLADPTALGPVVLSGAEPTSPSPESDAPGPQSPEPGAGR